MFSGGWKSAKPGETPAWLLPLQRGPLNWPIAGTPYFAQSLALTGKPCGVTFSTVKATISKKGQLVIPEPLKARDRIAAGQTFDIKRIDAGQYLLKREQTDKRPGIWSWLDACPEKGWFTPLPSESTDSL